MTARPRAMPLRAKSARSFICCSGETYGNMVTRSSLVVGCQPAVRHDPLHALGDSLVVQLAVPVRVDLRHERIDTTHGVGSTRGGILVRRVPERLDGDVDRALGCQAVAVPGFQGATCVPSAGAAGGEPAFFESAPDGVELVDPRHLFTWVVAGEQRYHDQSLHRHGQVAADQLRELVRLAL